MKNQNEQSFNHFGSMKSFLVASGLIMFLLCACQSAMENTDNPSGDSENPTSEISVFGAPFLETEGIVVQEALKRLETDDIQDSLVIIGRVKEVCQVKGCWMEVCDTSACDQTVFVQFLDYGFFMPKDLAGENVLMKGKLMREEVSVEDLQHFARDAGKSEAEINAIQKPEIKITFLASGVRVL